MAKDENPVAYIAAYNDENAAQGDYDAPGP
jgi:hypothetical protein